MTNTTKSFLTLLLICCVPLNSFATDEFSDVPDGNTHHDAIGRIKDSGVTSGCAVGLYCPLDDVRRDQMASFMDRGFGRVSFTTASLVATVPISTTASNTNLAEITIDVPGTGAGATQYVNLRYALDIEEPGNGTCPCNVFLVITHVGSASVSSEARDEIADGVGNCNTSTCRKQFNHEWTFAVSPGTNVFRVSGRVSASPPMGSVVDVLATRLTATTYPTGTIVSPAIVSTGTDSLDEPGDQ